MKKIKLESPALPSIYRDGGLYRLDYGFMRGSETFAQKSQAEEKLMEYLQNRIHSCAREMEALCKLQRKTIIGK